MRYTKKKREHSIDVLGNIFQGPVSKAEAKALRGYLMGLLERRAREHERQLKRACREEKAKAGKEPTR
jgi:hypothetical protein